MNPMMQGGTQPGMMPPGPPQGMGMPPPPPPQQPTKEQMALLDKPSWEQVIGLLQDNVHRAYRIDIETDSTIAGSIESDMQGLSQIMGAVSQFMEQTQPLVQSGMLPIEAAKEILMTITRRARMGAAVEDALDKMTAPKAAQPDPAIQIQTMKNQADAQKTQALLGAQQQADQIKQQHDEQLEMVKAQGAQAAEQARMQYEQQKLQIESQAEEQRSNNDMRIAQAEQSYQAQQDAQAQQLEAQREQQRQEADARFKQMEMSIQQQLASQKQQFELILAQMNNAAKIEVAEIAAQTAIDSAQIAGARTATEE